MGLYDIAPLGIKGPLLKYLACLFLLIKFSNIAPTWVAGWGVCVYPFLGLGGSLTPFKGWGLVSSLFRVWGLLAPLWGLDVGSHFVGVGSGGLVVGASPISFRVCIFHNQKMHVYLI